MDILCWDTLGLFAVVWRREGGGGLDITWRHVDTPGLVTVVGKGEEI